MKNMDQDATKVQIIDSYRIGLYTSSVEANKLRNFLRLNPMCSYEEHIKSDTSIFVFTAPIEIRKIVFKEFGDEELFTLEGNIVRELNK